jgi:hypothetical protein
MQDTSRAVIYIVFCTSLAMDVLTLYAGQLRIFRFSLVEMWQSHLDCAIVPRKNIHLYAHGRLAWIGETVSPQP